MYVRISICTHVMATPATFSSATTDACALRCLILHHRQRWRLGSLHCGRWRGRWPSWPCRHQVLPRTWLRCWRPSHRRARGPLFARHRKRGGCWGCWTPWRRLLLHISSACNYMVQLPRGLSERKGEQVVEQGELGWDVVGVKWLPKTSTWLVVCLFCRVVRPLSCTNSAENAWKKVVCLTDRLPASPRGLLTHATLRVSNLRVLQELCDNAHCQRVPSIPQRHPPQWPAVGEPLKTQRPRHTHPHPSSLPRHKAPRLGFCDLTRGGVQQRHEG